jgi:site-specific recombinase XerD
MDIAEALDELQRNKRLEGASPKTLAYYQVNVGSFVTFLTARGQPADLGHLTTVQARNWIEDMRDRGLAATTIQGYVRAVKTLSRWLVAEDYLPHDPLARLKLPKAPQAAKDTLTPQEVDRLLDACDRRGVNGLRDFAVLLLLFSTGIRASELRDITPADLNPGQNLITIRQGKGMKFRLIPYSPPTQRAIAAYLAHPLRKRFDRPEVFLTDDGTPLTQDGFRQIFRRLEAKTGIKCNPHKWRHTAAVQYLRNGGKVEALKTMLGHSTYDLTLRYARLAGVDLVEGHRQADPVKALKTKL